MNRFVTVLLAFVFVAIAAGLSFRIGSSKPPAERKAAEAVIKTVKSFPVTNETLTTQLEITGRLQAREKIELFTEVGGTLIPNNNRFKEGNYFKKGETLVRIDNEEQQLNLLAQKSALMNQITLMLPDLKSDYSEGFPAWDTYLKEMDIREPLKDLPSPSTDQERYFVSARNLYNLFYTIQSQEKRMEKYTVSAPFNGVLSSTNISEGTLVRIGQRLGEFMNSYSYELEASVNEVDIDLVKVGNQVELVSDNSSQSWKGRVSRISNVIDPATQTIKVFITTSGKGLKEGMYLSGTVKGRQIADAFEFPRNLLIDQSKVYVIENSRLSLKEVTPVHFTTEKVVVKGLTNGSVLLGESLAGAYEGLEVATL
ncbi:MAG: efflux RND transporter periplasmic adaptor subunit [Bacteroidota bacterium]